MKKILFVFIAGLLIAGCRENDKKADANAIGITSSDNSVNKTPDSVTTTNNNPAIDSANLTEVQWLDKQEKDYGKIKEGQNLEVSYKFKNTGNKALVISRVWAQCGCTVPETPQKPYAPGEEGVIKASFNSTGKAGTNTKEVYMSANTNPATTVMIFHVEVSPAEKH